MTLYFCFKCQIKVDQLLQEDEVDRKEILNHITDYHCWEYLYSTAHYNSTRSGRRSHTHRNFGDHCPIVVPLGGP